MTPDHRAPAIGRRFAASIAHLFRRPPDTKASATAPLIALQTMHQPVWTPRDYEAFAGAKHARITGAGIFKDSASDALIRSYLFNGTLRAWQVVIPDFGVVEGLFQVTTFELTGKHDGEVAFDLSLESAGELTFTAA